MVNADVLRKKILVVDDDPEVIRMLNRFLRRNGFEFFGAETIENAMKLMEQEIFDIALIDYQLGTDDAIDLCSRIRKHTTDLPLICMSGYVLDHEIESCKKAGFADVLKKPMEPVDLLASIERHIG